MAQGPVDGLGFEEVNQAVTSTAVVSGTNVYATTAVTAPAIVGTTSVSGANVYAATSMTGSIVSNADGIIKLVAAGVVACGAGSDGTVEFDTNLPSTTWAIGFATSGAACSATLPTISGALNVSGAEVIGDASTSYYFVATAY